MEMFIGKTHGELTTQRLDWGSLIGRDFVSPASILKILECCGMSNRAIQQREGLCILTAMAVLKYIQVQFFPAYYDRLTDRKDPMKLFNLLNRKIKVITYPCPMRRTSQRTNFLATDCSTAEALFCSAAIGINVDLQTRRPVPFPAKIKAHFSPENCMKFPELEDIMPLQGTNLQKLPVNAIQYSTTTTVVLTQIDQNEHVNNVFYIDFALNCLGEAFSKNVFKNFHSVLDHKICRFSLLFENEARLSDRIVTTTWQDPSNALVFKFHIKRDADLICQVEIEFNNMDRLPKSCL